MKFNSPEQINAHFDPLIAAAPDEQKPDLRLQKAEATSEFYHDQAAVANRNAWTVAALAKYPRAMPAAITGSTEEEVEASAKASHDFVQAAIDAANKPPEETPPPGTPPADPGQQGRDAYGAPSGGGQPGPDDPAVKDLSDLHAGLREAYPKGGSPVLTGTAKLKRGDDERIARLRLDPDWDAMTDQAAITGGPPAPAKTGAA